MNRASAKARAWKSYRAKGESRDKFELGWKAHLASEKRLHEFGSEQAREAFERGDLTKLVGFIALCFEHNRPVPQWARDALVDAFHKAATFQIGSWDEVFGPLLKKNEQLNAKRRKWVNQFKVVDRIWERSEAGKSITKDLFDSVGEELGISGTVASDLYYDMVKMVCE